MTDYTKIFHTVPFTAKELYRQQDGSKNNPGFPANWVQYSSKRNTDNTAVLGAIAREDFIGIDIDNTPVFMEAIDIDPDCEYITRSDLKGGHMLYAYNKEDAAQLQKIGKDAKRANIDIQLGNKLIYLATPGNKTKELLTEPLTGLPTKRIPKGIINLVTAHSYRVFLESPEKKYSADISTNYDNNMMENSTLGYLLEDENYTDEIIPRVIPSKSEWRHPKEVPMGAGTDWMNSVRFKLAQDPSISEEKFISFMLFLNSRWEDPMEESRVLNDCKFDIRDRLNNITGDILWKYNKDWKAEGFTYPNRYNDSIEVMYDSAQALFIEHNQRTKAINLYNKQTDIINSITANSKKRKKPKGEDILRKADSVTLVNTPEELPGKVSIPGEMPVFNSFKPSEGVKILKGIIDIKEPKEPKTILAFFENLMPDGSNRNRFFKFIAYKHTTYKPSELYFVLAGVGGAGKGILTSIILEYFSGSDRIQEVNLDKLENDFNSWKAVTDYAIIDEAGEGESRRNQAKLVGELKKMTGRSVVNITFKGKETGSSQRHYITPVATTNMNTKLITDGSNNDRRLVLFKCPNKLSKITDDTSEFVNRLEYELPHFAHYLKGLPQLSNSEYRDNKAWKNKDYEEYIQTTLEPIDKILEAIETDNLNGFLEVLTDDIGFNQEDIDNMFSVSKDETRMLLYNTTGSKVLNIKSLADLAETTSLLDISEVKIKLKQFKKKVIIYDMGKKVNAVVIAFKGTYVPLTNIAPIEN